MDFDLTPEQRELAERVTRLAKERFAPRARPIDEGELFPEENHADIVREGLHKAAIPREYGGLGYGITEDGLTWVIIVSSLARGDASTAQTFMISGHLVSMINAQGTEAQRRRFFAAVSEKGARFCSFGSEPTRFANAPGGFMETAAKRVPGGYVMNGVKHFGSLAGVAHYYMLWGVVDKGPDGGEGGLITPIVPAGTPGLNVKLNWHAMGMRGTWSNSADIKDVFVRDEDVVGPPGIYTKLPFSRTYVNGHTAVYLGTAEAALDFTVEYAQRFKDAPVIQYHLGEMAIDLEAARLMLYQAAWKGNRVGLEEASIRAQQAKCFVGQAAQRITGLALRVCGGRAATKDLPLERMFRDVHTFVLAPPNYDRCLEASGRFRLGLPSFRVESTIM